MMTSAASDDDRPGGVRRRIGFRRPPVMDLPFRVLYPVLVVEFLAGGLWWAAAVHESWPAAVSWWPAAVLVAAGVAHAEIARGVERIRRRVTDGNTVDLTSVWTFSAALLVPPLVACLAAVTVHSYVWSRTRHRRKPLYRHVFSTSTVVLACLAAHVVGTTFTHGQPLVAVVLALLAYTAVNSCLVAAVIALSSPRPTLTTVFASPDANLLELATLSVGALVAAAMSIHVGLLVFAALPLAMLHRGAMVEQLRAAAATDFKTGLVSAAAWHANAEGLLRDPSSRRGVRGVLMCDVDHFKRINDTYGHLIGDAVLAEIATVLRDAVRPDDMVGRFGGEEFVILLRSADVASDPDGDLQATAERLLRRVLTHDVVVTTPDGPMTIDGLTVSVGGAVLGTDEPGSLTDLLEVADAALFAAKRAGRNRARTGRMRPAASTPTVTATSSALTVRDEPVAQDHPDVRPLSP
jgi:diguanylate cyclase (GGDEF)-like protein